MPERACPLLPTRNICISVPPSITTIIGTLAGALLFYLVLRFLARASTEPARFDSLVILDHPATSNKTDAPKSNKYCAPQKNWHGQVVLGLLK